MDALVARLAREWSCARRRARVRAAAAHLISANSDRDRGGLKTPRYRFFFAGAGAFLPRAGAAARSSSGCAAALLFVALAADA